MEEQPHTSSMIVQSSSREQCCSLSVRSEGSLTCHGFRLEQETGANAAARTGIAGSQIKGLENASICRRFMT